MWTLPFALSCFSVPLIVYLNSYYALVNLADEIVTAFFPTITVSNDTEHKLWRVYTVLICVILDLF